MAQSVSPTPVAAMDVHVTGRRVLATIVDCIVLGVLFAVMSMLFGSSSARGTSVSFSMGTFPTLGFFVVAMAYYILMEGYLGQTVGKMLLGIKVVREDSGEVPGIGSLPPLYSPKCPKPKLSAIRSCRSLKKDV